MADNVPITAGSGTTIATDDVAGAHYQIVKLAFGPLDTATLVTTAEGLPFQEDRPATATLANVTASATSVTLRASNALRMGLMIFNDSSASLYIKFGATASATSFTVFVGPSAYYELPNPVYTGIVDGIWTAAVGTARITETTS